MILGVLQTIDVDQRKQSHAIMSFKNLNCENIYTIKALGEILLKT